MWVVLDTSNYHFYMLLCAAQTHGKLPGLKVQRWELHAVGDLQELPGNEGKLAAGKHVSYMSPDYLSHE